jgi:protein-L-isoaspartate(D-aspartate) O-methyltransferase
MIEALELTPQDTVLEIGTGRGYQTALLARLALRVVSVERIPELAQIARANLRGEGITNAQVVVADGTLGVPDSAPFDAIVVSAAFVRVPPPLVAQLTERARLVMPVGDDQTALVKVLEKRDDALVELMVLCGARFVPLLGVNGYEID